MENKRLEEIISIKNALYERIEILKNKGMFTALLSDIKDTFIDFRFNTDSWSKLASIFCIVLIQLVALPFTIISVISHFIRKNKIKDLKKQITIIEQQENYLLMDEDRMYSLIICCPTCEGTGNCIVVVDREFAGGEDVTPLKYHWRKAYVNKVGWKYWYWENEVFQSFCKEQTCPNCGGQGIAYAYFDVVEDVKYCIACMGCGKIKDKDNKELLCEECDGKGSSIITKNIVRIKYLQMSNTRDIPLDFSLDDIYNKELFSKNKQRFPI